MRRLGMYLAAILLLAVGGVAQAEQPGDAHALKGVSQARILWDIQLTDTLKLDNWLTVIRDTHEALAREGVEPRMVLIFRGEAVELLSRSLDHVPLEQMGMIQDVHRHLRALDNKAHVELRACHLALRRYGMADAKLVKGVEPVTNSFLAIAGYGRQGYTRIPVP